MIKTTCPRCKEIEKYCICLSCIDEIHERKMTEADDKIGFWLSAALEDDKVCKEMKEDIRSWFDQF